MGSYAREGEVETREHFVWNSADCVFHPFLVNLFDFFFPTKPDF